MGVLARSRGQGGREGVERKSQGKSLNIGSEKSKIITYSTENGIALRRSMNYIGDWNSFAMKKNEIKWREKERKKLAEGSPRAVGGAGICILNGLRFITVGPGEVLAIHAINKERSNLAIDAATTDIFVFHLVSRVSLRSISSTLGNCFTDKTVNHCSVERNNEKVCRGSGRGLRSRGTRVWKFTK